MERKTAPIRDLSWLLEEVLNVLKRHGFKVKGIDMFGNYVAYTFKGGIPILVVYNPKSATCVVAVLGKINLPDGYYLYVPAYVYYSPMGKFINGLEIFRKVLKKYGLSLSDLDLEAPFDETSAKMLISELVNELDRVLGMVRGSVSTY